MSEWKTDEITLQLSNPLTQEDIDLITDANMERTTKVWFHTPNGNEVEFMKVVRCAECKYFQCNMRHDGTLPHGVDEYECRHWCGYCDPTDYCSYGERWKNDTVD